MSWRAISADDVLVEFSATEQAKMNAVQGGNTQLAAILENVVYAFLGAMAASGDSVSTDGSVPDQLREDIIALTRWRWLISLPSVNESLQSKERQAAADRAEENLKLIAQKKYGYIEAPAGAVTTTGNWNSENKIVMRGHPTPSPASQFPVSGTRPYANPDAPADT